MLPPPFTNPPTDPDGEIAFAHLRERIGELNSEDVPAIAVRALERGSESTSAIELAGTISPTWSDIGPTWSKWMHELGYPSLSSAEAELMLARIEARDVAEKILAGTLNPEEGVFSFEGINSKYQHPAFLNEFCWLSSHLAYHAATDEDRERILELTRQVLLTSNVGSEKK